MSFVFKGFLYYNERKDYKAKTYIVIQFEKVYSKEGELLNTKEQYKLMRSEEEIDRHVSTAAVQHKCLWWEIKLAIKNLNK